MLRRRSDDLVVHPDVRVVRGTQRQPEDVLDVRRLERGEYVVDLRGVVIGEVVVADGDHDGRPDLRCRAA